MNKRNRSLGDHINAARIGYMERRQPPSDGLTTCTFSAWLASCFHGNLRSGRLYAGRGGCFETAAELVVRGGGEQFVEAVAQGNAMLQGRLGVRVEEVEVLVHCAASGLDPSALRELSWAAVAEVQGAREAAARGARLSALSRAQQAPASSSACTA